MVRAEFLHHCCIHGPKDSWTRWVCHSRTGIRRREAVHYLLEKHGLTSRACMYAWEVKQRPTWN